jgi:hypothetical protein
MRSNVERHSEEAEKAVREIRRATRRQYSAEEKVRIVIAGLRGEDGIAELFGVAGMGVVLGTLYTSIAATALFGPPIVGAIIDRAGSYQLGILFTIATTLAGFLVLLALRPRRVPAAENEMRSALAHSEM